MAENRKTNLAISYVKFPFIREGKNGAQYNAATGGYMPEKEVDASKEIIRDGNQDDFPLYLLNVVTSSPTAMACLSTYERFLKGSGFNYKELDKHKVNREGTTAKMLLKHAARDMSKLRRFAIRVKYKAKLDESGNAQYDSFDASLEYCPAKWVRYEVDANGTPTEKLRYNPYYGTRDYDTNKDKTVVFYPFNPNPGQIFKEVKECYENDQEYPGQLFFYNEEPERNGVYSFPEYFAAEDAIKADIEINVFNFNNIINSFLISSIMLMQGDPNEMIPHPDYFDSSDDDTVYISRKELFEDQMSQNFAGAEQAGKVMVLWVRNIEQSAKFLEFPTNKNMSDQYVNTRKDLTEQIVRACKIPNVLANIESAGKLGNTKEIQMAIKMLNDETDDNRTIIETAFDRLLPLTGFVKDVDKEVQIVPINPNFEIPQWVADYIPIPEKDEFIENNFGIDIDRGEVVGEIDTDIID